MKHMRIPSLALAALLCVPAAAAPAAAAEEPLSRAASAQQAIEAAAQYGGAVSIQYALWQDGAITMTGHAGAFSRTENRALTDQDLYGIGSVSKLYTTAALLQLCEAGKVDLDAPVTRYLPGFTMADERYRDITVRMLLNHSSGLMGDSTRSAFLFDAYTGAGTDDLLERLSTQRLKADPGAYSVYCNDGFTLAELVVEAVSGQDFTDYLRTHLLEEAGLTRTFTPADDFDRDDLARIYQGSDTRALPADTLKHHRRGRPVRHRLRPGRLRRALLRGQRPAHRRLLAVHRRGGVRPGPLAGGERGRRPGLRPGLGQRPYVPLQPQRHPRPGQGGDTLYYHAGLIVLPEEDMAVAVVSSGGVSTYNQLAGVQILLDALAEEGVQAAQPTALPDASPAPMPEGLAQAVSGAYSGLGAALTVSPSADGQGVTFTAVAALGGRSMDLTYYSDGSFRDADNAVRYRFVTEDNGRTYLYEQAYTVLPGLPATGVAQYALERLEDNPLSPPVEEAWQARSQKLYLILNEDYRGETYVTSSLFASLGMLPELPGYAANCRIVDETHARARLTLPGTGSRNGADLTFSVENGVEYLQFGDYRCMDAAAAPALYTGPGAALSIQADGYARWCRVGAAAGKTLQVARTGEGGFTVYDASGLVTASSVAWGDTSAVLPEGGWVVFAGEPGTRFQLSA